MAPIIRDVVATLAEGSDAAEVSSRFHRTLSLLFLEAIQATWLRTGLKEVVLAGGVFQNEILLGETARLLEEAGFIVFRPELVPANDGAVALGQAAVARARLSGRSQVRSS